MDQKEENGRIRTWGGETRQNQLYKPFLRAALVAVLTIGCTLGALNLAVMGFKFDLGAVWTSLIQAHAYAQIFGWVGLFIMGIAYHTMPRFYLRPLRHPELVSPSLLLVVSGLLMRFLTQPFATNPVAAWLMVLSSLLGFAGMSLFAWAMYDTMTRGSDTFGTPAYRLYLGAGFAWLWVASASTVVVMAYLALSHLDAIPPSWDAPYLRAALSGAIVCVILGYTARTVPHMMGLKTPSTRWLRVIFAVYILSVIAQIMADAGIAGIWLSALGAAGEMAALLGFVAVVGIFTARPGGRAQLSVKNPWPERFVRTAYFWLLFSSALNLSYALSAFAGRGVPHAFIASYHHALTVGFVSMMIVGMSMRLVPVFIGVMNKQPQVAGVIFALLLAGNTTRIFSESLAYLYGGVFYVLMGLSGFVEVCGLALYAAMLWPALARPSYGQEKERAAWRPLGIAKGSSPSERGTDTPPAAR